MLNANRTFEFSRRGAAPAKRRRNRLAPVRRIRRALATGICAGAALLSGAAIPAQAQQGAAQQPVMPVGYNAALRGHAGSVTHGAPHCHSYPYTYTPSYGPCLPYGQAPTPAQPSDQTGADQAQSDAAPDAAPTPAPAPVPAPVSSSPSMSSASGSQSSPASASVNSIGDFYGITSYRDTILTPDPIFGIAPYAIPNPGESLVGRIKAAENNSPFPQDRVFLDYTAYQNVPFGLAEVDVERFVPGFERTFQDGLFSVEMRMPLAQTLDSTLVAGAPLETDSWEAGNLYVATKMLLYNGEFFTFAGGMGISTPTAQDIDIVASPAFSTSIENRAVHLLPYFAMQFVPGETFFFQYYIQTDVDLNGNPVYVNGDLQGVYQAETLLYNDLVFGAWLYDDPSSSLLRSVAGVTELHFTNNLSDPDTITGASADIAGGDPDLDIVTGIVGLHFLYAGGARVTLGYGAPLADDRFADGELRVMLNWGPPFGALGSLAGVGR